MFLYVNIFHEREFPKKKSWQESAQLNYFEMFLTQLECTPIKGSWFLVLFAFSRMCSMLYINHPGSGIILADFPCDTNELWGDCVWRFVSFPVIRSSDLTTCSWIRSRLLTVRNPQGVFLVRIHTFMMALVEMSSQIPLPFVRQPTDDASVGAFLRMDHYVFLQLRRPLGEVRTIGAGIASGLSDLSRWHRIQTLRWHRQGTEQTAWGG